MWNTKQLLNIDQAKHHFCLHMIIMILKIQTNIVEVILNIKSGLMVEKCLEKMLTQMMQVLSHHIKSVKSSLILSQLLRPIWSKI